jgi:hypothetical protein
MAWWQRVRMAQIRDAVGSAVGAITYTDVTPSSKCGTKQGFTKHGVCVLDQGLTVAKHLMCTQPPDMHQ